MPNAGADLLVRLRAAVDPPPPALGDDALPGSSAAVLLLVDPDHEGLPLLFIRRTHQVPSHRGQIAFPGGGAAPGDGGPVGTALREAREEMNVDPDAVEVLGLLSPVTTATSMRLLTPVVALQRGPHEPVPDPFEVAEWFRVGIGDLLAAPQTSRRIPALPGRVMVHFFEVDGRVIWGATAAIVDDLLRRLRATPRPDRAG